MVTYRTFVAIDRSIRRMGRAMKILRAKYGHCPVCGGALMVRKGRCGKFLGCSNYLKCKFTRDL